MKKYLMILMAFVMSFALAGIASAEESKSLDEGVNVGTLLSGDHELISYESDILIDGFAMEDLQYGYAEESFKVESSEDEGVRKLSNQVASDDWKRLVWQIDVYSGVNIHLYTFEYEIYWEYNGSKITRVAKNSKPTVHAAGWRYEGLITDSGLYYNNNANYLTTRQAHMTFGIGGWDAQYMYPYITYDVTAKGGWTAERGTK